MKVSIVVVLLAISHFISALAHTRLMQQFSQQSFTPVCRSLVSLSFNYFSLFVLFPLLITIIQASKITFCCDSYKFPHFHFPLFSHFFHPHLKVISLSLFEMCNFSLSSENFTLISLSKKHFHSRNWKEELSAGLRDSVRRDTVKQLSCSFDDIPQSYLKIIKKRKRKAFNFNKTKKVFLLFFLNKENCCEKINKHY